MKAMKTPLTEDNVAIDFVVAKCSNGSDEIVTFNKTRIYMRDVPKVFVSNFYVERIKFVEDLRELIIALGFGGNSPWVEL